MADPVEDLAGQQSRAQHAQSPLALEEELMRVHAQAKKYQEQNARLRMLLESFIVGRDGSQSPIVATPNMLMADASTLTETEGDFEHLTIKYNKLDKASRIAVRERDDYKQQRDRYKRQMEDYREHFHKAKRCIKEWQIYYDNQKRKTSTESRVVPTDSPNLPERWTTPASIVLTDSNETRGPQNQVGPRRSISPQLPPPPTLGFSDNPTCFQSLPGASLPNVSSDPRGVTREHRAAHSAGTEVAQRCTTVANSSQMTADEEASAEPRPAPFTALEAVGPHSDPVEFVSERPVRRPFKQSRQPADRRSKGGNDGNTARQCKLKDESLSPVGPSGFPRIANSESLDLDEFSGYVETPSKLKRTYRVCSREDSRLELSSQEQGRSSSMPADFQAVASPCAIHKHDGRASRSFNTLGDIDKPKRNCETVSDHPHLSDRVVLRPISVNKQLLTHISKTKQHNYRHVQAGIEFLAEDGEDVSPTPGKSAGSTFVTSSESKRRKLDALLEKPSSRHPTSTRQQCDRADRRDPNVKASAGTSASKTVDSLSKPKRLRDIPLTDLILEDFRINPHATSTDKQGYAYTETIRGRDARRCLPGCTDPRCCGSAFSKMVSIGGLAPQAPNSMWDARTQDEPAHVHDQRTEERRLLDWHIGRNSTAQKRIAALTPAERRAAVLDARAALLAERYGKHRQAFTRRASPPGFWRTDMPTTQESKDDRAKQMEAVREQVRERWEEAMRGGRGARWVFRDEL